MNDRDRRNAALDIISRFGDVDGAHHKQWLLDQVVRLLTASEADYQAWVAETRRGDDGPETYAWETGVAP